MTDAFSDVLEDADGEDSPDTSPDSTETVTDTYTATDDGSVRSTLPQSDEILDDSRYSDPDSENAADDVDSRALFRQPDINEIRYYARENPYGKAIVHKPINDAFKHGFEIVGDYTEPEDGNGKIADFLQEYKSYHKEARWKARRDGMTVLLYQFADSADSAAEPLPTDGQASFRGFKLFTLDNLTDTLTDSLVEDYTEYDDDQIYVTEGAEHGGVALVDDISNPDHGKILGFGIEPRQESTDVDDVSFVHASRCQHFTHGEWVDGDLGNNVTGKHVGESALTPVLQALKASQMGFWALKEILHRYSAPLHAVEPPETWGKDEWDDAEEKLDNLAMSSESILPPGAELSVAEGVSEFDPEPLYEVIIEGVCAGTVFTKPVLLGAQQGTVSGSETSLKGYFNEVHLLRSEDLETDMRDALRMVSKADQSTVPRVADVENVEIDWGPLLKPTDIKQVEGAVSLITAATNGIKNYVLTPDEARTLVSEEWAKFDLDIDLDELSEDDWDSLDRINIRETGQLSPEDEPDMGGTRQNPTLKNGGGQPEGQTRESEQPQRTGDSLTDEEVERIADALAEQLSED